MSDAAPPTWTRPGDVRAGLKRRWEQGVVLSALVRGENLFPQRIPLRGPDSKELANRFDDARAWIAEWRAEDRLRLEEREFAHRVLGNNRVPTAVWMDSPDLLADWIGCARDLRRFRERLALTREGHPHLLEWLAAHAPTVLRLADEWPHLLAVVAWLRANPRPGVYLRQLDLPGVHTKFVEAHRKVLGELLDLSLPAEAIDANASGAAGFNRRYGFRDKPERVRFRILDPAIALPGDEGPSPSKAGIPARSFKPDTDCTDATDFQRDGATYRGHSCPQDADEEHPGENLHPLGLDLTIDAEAFAHLNPDVDQVFITENEINFLAFPLVPRSIVIFGGGYGFDGLAGASWLRTRRVRYWGDIDTHGFAILDQLRVHLPQAESLLMNRATLLRFRDLWGTEPSPTNRDLPRLTSAETELYHDLRTHRLAPNLRLEQERISFAWLRAALAEGGHPCPPVDCGSPLPP